MRKIIAQKIRSGQPLTASEVAWTARLKKSIQSKRRIKDAAGVRRIDQTLDKMHMGINRN